MLTPWLWPWREKGITDITDIGPGIAENPRTSQCIYIWISV